MPCKLPLDCLYEIFKHLENDTLRSCLLVNHFWCEVSVPILWTSIQNHNTLIACLPNESKEILCKNEIIISTPTSKPLLFNYVAFIKKIIIRKIENILQFDHNKNKVIIQEIFKMFMNKISLKTLDFFFNSEYIQNIPLTTYPGARDCLRNLSELTCGSSIPSEFFDQLSPICHHIQSLDINIFFGSNISNGLSDLISVQQDIKYLRVRNNYNCESLTKIIPPLTKSFNSIIELDIYLGKFQKPLSFIANFTNLQVLILSSSSTVPFVHHIEYFKSLQHVTFSQLRIFMFYNSYEFHYCSHSYPNNKHLIKFLKNNLKEICFYYANTSLKSSIANFCSNLRSLHIRFKVEELEAFKAILNGCQQLESIETWCDKSLFEGVEGNYINKNKLLENIVKFSPKNFYELKIHYRDFIEGFFPKELEHNFKSWANRIPQKPLSLIIYSRSCFHPKFSEFRKERKEIIEKFKKLGVIKKFEILIEHSF